MQPHRWQSTRLSRPWDSPGKNTGVDCHFLLQCMKMKSQSEVAQSCPTLRDPMDCSPPGSSIHGIFQARVLKWGAIAFSGKPLWRTIFQGGEKSAAVKITTLWFIYLVNSSCDHICWKQDWSANTKCSMPASVHQAAVVMVGEGEVGRPQNNVYGNKNILILDNNWIYRRYSEKKKKFKNFQWKVKSIFSL